MSLKEIEETINDLCNALPRSVVTTLLRGLRRAKERRDPALIYHYLSFHSRSYLGMNLLYKSEPFHKVYPNALRIPLPEPPKKSGVDLFTAIESRRSRRSFSSDPLSLEEVSALLYYTAGITAKTKWGELLRAYPSAGNLQPVELYLAVSRVENLEKGLYHYNPSEHSLEMLEVGDFSAPLTVAALDQVFIERAPLNLIVTAVYRRTAQRYGLRAYRYVLLDSAMASEHIYLIAEALNLATVAVGAFYDDDICRILRIDCEEEIPVLLFPVGRRKD
ncbi:MAG: SagB family peptide dehydrogenase [Acidilobaceae archaeon]